MAGRAARALVLCLSLLVISGASPGEEPCGFKTDCPRTYSLTEVNRSALAQGASYNGTRPISAEQLRRMMSKDAASRLCSSRRPQSTGGYCYPPPSEVQGDWVPLPHGGGTFYFPKAHKPPDSALVALLLELVRADRTPSLTLNDFGAGVGLYGVALHAHAPGVVYRGYDGAANVEAASNGRVSYFNLAAPLRLPKADWVMSIEVAEHVPSRFEGTLVRNLHAHNCRGIVLSWAALGQDGIGHVNCHSSEYVVGLFRALGYVYDVKSTMRVREFRLPPGYHEAWVPNATVIASAKARGKRWPMPPYMVADQNGSQRVRLPWLRRTLHVFRRITPLRHPECTALPEHGTRRRLRAVVVRRSRRQAVARTDQ